MDPFEQALGDHFTILPQAVQNFHRAGNRRFHGETNITRGDTLLGRLMLRAGGFPPAGNNIPVHVQVDQLADKEVWTRNFAGHIMQSCLRFTGTDGELEESFGPLTLHLRLTATPEALCIGIAKITLFKYLHAPRFLLPDSQSNESSDPQGRFRFNITATAPFAGFLIRYSGHLVAE